MHFRKKRDSRDAQPRPRCHIDAIPPFLVPFGMPKFRRLPVCLLLCGAYASLAYAQTFEVTETSIADEQKAMTEGRTTSRALVEAYLKRIDAYDHKGPKLNAILTINPNAIKEAEALDRERAQKGVRGPLHGIPVIVKDNYSTTDMPTTAGTIALLGFIPSIDAFQVKKLREAGAVIIAKSNLHETRLRYHHHQFRRRPDPQPLRPHAQSRRIERRHRCGHRGKFRRGRHGQRYLWIHPHPVVA